MGMKRESRRKEACQRKKKRRIKRAPHPIPVWPFITRGPQNKRNSDMVARENPGE
jgi:hypothetical protein